MTESQNEWQTIWVESTGPKWDIAVEGLAVPLPSFRLYRAAAERVNNSEYGDGWVEVWAHENQFAEDGELLKGQIRVVVKGRYLKEGQGTLGPFWAAVLDIRDEQKQQPINGALDQVIPEPLTSIIARAIRRRKNE